MRLSVILGIVLTSIGLVLLLTVGTPTRAQSEGAYGDLGGDLQSLGGWVVLGVGVLALLVGLVRMLKSQKHDPDLPPEYRV